MSEHRVTPRPRVSGVRAGRELGGELAESWPRAGRELAESWPRAGCELGASWVARRGDRALVLGLEEVRGEVERPHAQGVVGRAGDGEAGREEHLLGVGSELGVGSLGLAFGVGWLGSGWLGPRAARC